MLDLLHKITRRLSPQGEPIKGYQQPDLVETIFAKTVAYAPRPEEVLSAIGGAAAVLDFGGGCGIHYKQAAPQSPLVRWAVVETPAMIARARALQTDNLQFFSDVAEAAGWLGSVDVVHSNGALQYTPDPLRALGELCGLRAPAMLWRRTYLSEGDAMSFVQRSHLVDNGPGKALPGMKNRPVFMDVQKIPEVTFLAKHAAAGYVLAERGDDAAFRFVRAQ